MNRFKNLRTIALLCVVLIAVLAVSTAITQVKKGKTRPMMTEQWMEGVMAPHSAALRKGLQAEPADDKAWEKLAMHAALLNEASYVLMADGRCPDEVWANAASEILREGSADALKAIEAKDLEAAKNASASIGAACKACHSVHRKKE